MESVWAAASLWTFLALGASLISIRIGLSVALVEIFMGVIGGNALGMHTAPWIDFLAAFGSVLLTFLAGAEIDPTSLRKHLKASLAIGVVSFLLPFVGAWLFAYFLAGWNLRAAQIAGVALSTTSVAVVYAVMVETRLNETDLGKLILAACFITDLGTVLALGLLFATFDLHMVLFIAATVPVLWLLPKVGPWVIAHWGGRISEPEVKFFFFILFVLAWLATTANSEGVLPAYLVGLVSAGMFVRERAMLHRVRSVSFVALTPFFFIKAGLLISIPSLIAGAGLIVAFFLVKMAAKIVGVWPVARAFHLPTRESTYTTLLMSTGLTFGSISALFGLTHGVIDQSQYSILVTVVIASAVVPTLIAQTWFQPKAQPAEAPAAITLPAAIPTKEMTPAPKAEP